MIGYGEVIIGSSVMLVIYIALLPLIIKIGGWVAELPNEELNDFLSITGGRGGLIHSPRTPPLT